MSADLDILELKFEGNGINPSTVKPSEIALQIEQFEKALLSTIKAEHPEIDTTALLFTLEGVKNESIGIPFLANLAQVAPEIKSLVIASYLTLTTSIKDNDFSRLSAETIGSLKTIQRFSKKHNCNANFRYNGESLSLITPNSEIKENRSLFVKGDTTIYGELIDVGGENPNLHIKINDEYVIIVDTDKSIAKQLGSKLFDTIGLKGLAKWDVTTSRIIEFKLYDILDYKSGNVANTFAELRRITSGGWDNFNSNDEINRQLLRD